jgi:probable phosphoglycerate mutase
VGARADRALARLREAEGEAALAFAHGHLLRVLAARWICQEAAAGGRLLLGPAAIGVLGYERSRAAIATWNTARV